MVTWQTSQSQPLEPTESPPSDAPFSSAWEAHGSCVKLKSALNPHRDSQSGGSHGVDGPPLICLPSTVTWALPGPVSLEGERCGVLGALSTPGETVLKKLPCSLCCFLLLISSHSIRVCTGLMHSLCCSKEQCFSPSYLSGTPFPGRAALALGVGVRVGGGVAVLPFAHRGRIHGFERLCHWLEVTQ